MEKPESSITPDDQLKDLPNVKPAKLRQARKLEAFHLVTGDSCSGKSWAIRQQLDGLLQVRNIDASMAVTLTEDFTPSVFIRKFLEAQKQVQAQQPLRVGVHLNVSAYAPMAEVSRFLYAFLLWGQLWDFNTGAMHTISNTVSWHIFVELGIAPQDDARFGQLSTFEAVLRSLPIVKHLAEAGAVQAEFVVTAEERLVAAFLQAQQGGKLNAAGITQIVADNGPAAGVIAALNVCFNRTLPQRGIEIPRLMTHQRAFVRLLADRCRWMQQQVRFLVAQQAQGIRHVL